MQVRPLGLDGVFEILPRKFGDDRGFFSETYKANALSDAGIDFSFVQDNHSYSAAKGLYAVFITSCHHLHRISWFVLRGVQFWTLWSISAKARRRSESGSHWKSRMKNGTRSWSRKALLTVLSHSQRTQRLYIKCLIIMRRSMIVRSALMILR